MKRWIAGLVVVAVFVLAIGTAAKAEIITHGSTTIYMDFVNVGNAGNTPDDTGYGAVSYDYCIQTIAGKRLEFLRHPPASGWFHGVA